MGGLTKIWCVTVGHIKEAYLVGRHAQSRSRLKRLITTEPPQPISRMRPRLRMRLCTISDNDYMNFSAELRCPYDQSAATQALIIRMRRHDQQRPVFYHFSEIDFW